MEREAQASSFDGPLSAPRETLPEIWDAELVGKRLVQAFATLDRLPRLRGPREPGGHWPRELRDVNTGMALVTTLWALRSARGRSIKKLCTEKQWAPHTFFRKRAKAPASLA
jgi:hypothetical protein